MTIRDIVDNFGTINNMLLSIRLSPDANSFWNRGYGQVLKNSLQQNYPAYFHRNFNYSSNRNLTKFAINETTNKHYKINKWIDETKGTPFQGGRETHNASIKKMKELECDIPKEWEKFQEIVKSFTEKFNDLEKMQQLEMKITGDSEEKIQGSNLSQLYNEYVKCAADNQQLINSIIRKNLITRKIKEYDSLSQETYTDSVDYLKRIKSANSDLNEFIKLLEKNENSDFARQFDIKDLRDTYDRIRDIYILETKIKSNINFKSQTLCNIVHSFYREVEDYNNNNKDCPIKDQVLISYVCEYILYQRLEDFETKIKETEEIDKLSLIHDIINQEYEDLKKEYNSSWVETLVSTLKSRINSSLEKIDASFTQELTNTIESLKSSLSTDNKVLEEEQFRKEILSQAKKLINRINPGDDFSKRFLEKIKRKIDYKKIYNDYKNMTHKKDNRFFDYLEQFFRKIWDFCLKTNYAKEAAKKKFNEKIEEIPRDVYDETRGKPRLHR